MGESGLLAGSQSESMSLSDLIQWDFLSYVIARVSSGSLACDQMHSLVSAQRGIKPHSAPPPEHTSHNFKGSARGSSFPHFRLLSCCPPYGCPAIACPDAGRGNLFL